MILTMPISISNCRHKEESMTSPRDARDALSRAVDAQRQQRERAGEVAEEIRRDRETAAEEGKQDNGSADQG